MGEEAQQGAITLVLPNPRKELINKLPAVCEFG